jgi:hypothetical protein
MGNDDLQRSLGRVEGMLAGLQASVDKLGDSVVRLNTSFESLEAGRLSALETKVAEQTVRMSLLAASIPTVISALFLIVQHFWK